MYFTHSFFSQSTFLWDRRRKSRIGMGFYKMCRISEADKWRLKSGASLTFLEPCWTRKLGKPWNQGTCALLHTAWSTAEVGMGSPDLRVTQTSYSEIPCTLFPQALQSEEGGRSSFAILQPTPRLLFFTEDPSSPTALCVQKPTYWADDTS